jgi:hypothetical protein
MTANPARLGVIHYADEASFAEVSTTFDQRLPHVGNVNDIITGLEQSLIDPGHVRQYMNERSRGFKSVQGGQFTIRLYLTGHGSATTGVISATELATFLGRVVGNSDATQVGGTVNTPTSAIQFTTTGVTTASGKMLRIGAINDGDGNGQYAYVNVAATLTLRNAIAGAPLNGAIIYAPELVYPSEGPTSASITSLRFQVISADQRYNIYGCYPTSMSISGLNIVETPMVDVSFACAAWETESASTFPSSTSTDFFPAAPVAGGTLWINDVGTTTYQTVDYRNLTLTIDLQTVGKTGPGTPRTYQALAMCRRTKCCARLNFELDSETAGTDTWGGKWNAADASRTEQHAVLTLATGDGQAVGFKFPNLYYIDRRPTQFDSGGLNAKNVSFEAGTGTDTTNDITRAAWMLALG